MISHVSRLTLSILSSDQVGHTIQQELASETAGSQEESKSPASTYSGAECTKPIIVKPIVVRPTIVKPTVVQRAVDKPSNFYAKNWDKIVNDFEEEEKNTEGQSIDDLLKDIYNKGNDETRRAISKSFQESNGTVLSTSWNEVSQSTVEVKPPDGCEFKSWQS